MVDIWISLHLDGAKNKPTKPVLRGPNIWTIPWWHYFFGVITFKQQKPSTACSFDRNQQQTSGRLDAWAKHWSECWSIIISRFFNGNCLALSGIGCGRLVHFFFPHHHADLRRHPDPSPSCSIRTTLRNCILSTLPESFTSMCGASCGKAAGFYGGMPSNMVVSANGGTPKLMVYEGKPY